ncbi:pyridoxal phosphate-dependent decarboxylase family protein [Amycolatopsis regifaucium]|uniref:Amino acid decarboxylase n=1 Tax=Amycolatopsis regifaucium TaxID=546365 RepID=A0A154M6W1_9PSEU|nr:aminotransferase class V-fold PLP-dependent enzyme [Amycolatopsis regifaucium]KZB80361.1 amino acid decarboxylase [Amycolatopsis regifaucium]OKA05330.1 amino acid decarboxylase [Amycolatopsis regifaucium]SFJ06022.1 aromatic-L-amino-acid decarboxylase [Amycolatopsis regifaucium]
MLPLEPSDAELRELGTAALDFVTSFVTGLPDRPAHDPTAFDGDVSITDDARPLGELLDTVGAAAAVGVETAGPRYLGYIPAGGLVTSAIAGLLTLTMNRFGTVADMAPGLVAIEESVLRWLCAEFGLPAGSGGVLTSGGSLATLTAVVAARRTPDGTLYVSEHTHVCVAKAASIAGLPSESVRVVPVDDELRMDPLAAARMIAEDRRRGLVPFLIAGTAGTTDTGAVDPLAELADLARRENLWFHVDGAYGGAFQLTERGRARFAGIEQADSITLDPHKGLFLPYGIGALLVRDTATLDRAYHRQAAYYQDLGRREGLPDYAHRGLELTREHRGLAVWLPLRLHGVQSFRDALDEKLDLAWRAYEELLHIPGLDLPWPPQLSTVVFRASAGDEATERLFDEIRARGRYLLTSTRIRGRFFIRLCVLSHRTHAEHVLGAVEEIRSLS